MSNSTEYPYHVVQFITAGRQPKTRKTDVVATKWLYYDKAKKKCFTRYPPPPYDDEKYQYYNDALADLITAPESWNNYHVKLRGKAKSLNEAFQKLESLKENESALTVDSDENFSEAEKKAVNLLRQQKLLKESNTFKNKYTSQHNLPLNKNVCEKKSSIDLSPEAVISSPLVNVEYSDLNINMFENFYEESEEHELPEVDCSPQNNINLVDSTLVPPKSTSKEPQRHGSSLNAYSSDASFKENVLNIVKEANKQDLLFVTHSSNTAFEEKLLGYWTETLSEVREVKCSIQQLTAEFREFKMISSNSGSGTTFISTTKQFNSTFKHIIPLTSVVNFMHFDEDLNKDKALKAAVCNLLQTCLDASLVLSKCIVNMLKLFLTKDLALMFVAVKKVKNKAVMRDTNFYNCIEAIIKERRNISGLSTSDKDLITALSNVLSNAGSWFVQKKKDDNQGKVKKHHLENDKSLITANVSSKKSRSTAVRSENEQTTSGSSCKIQKLNDDVFHSVGENFIDDFESPSASNDSEEEFNENYLSNLS